MILKIFIEYNFFHLYHTPMANTITNIITFMYGKRIGKDSFNNIYYESKKYRSKPKRWVIYANKDDEPTRIPPVYASWLRHTIVDFPNTFTKYKWQSQPKPNKTGTPQAHILPGHLLRPGTQRSYSMNGDYQAWTPPHGPTF